MNGTEYVYAQWTEKDSVWLQKVISGKEKIELNPEALKAIESGTLINTDKPASNMQMAPGAAPATSITKDFSEYIRSKNTEQDNPHRKVALKDLPPSVFRLYGPGKPLQFKMLGSFYIPESVRAEGVRPSGRSFDDMLKQVFMPSERAKRRNAKRWRTNKYYNNYP